MAVTDDEKKKATQPSAARTLGTATRLASRVANPVSSGALNAGVTAAAAPVRRTLTKAVGEFVGGFAGTGAPPRTATPAAPPAAGASAAAPAQPALNSGEAPGAVTRLPNSPTAGAAAMPKPGDPQTFTGRAGTRQLPSYAPAAPQSQVQRTLSRQVVAPDNPTRHAGPRVQGAVIGGAPGGATGGVYGGEAERRRDIALMTDGKGSPTARRMIWEAYNQQQGGQQEMAMAQQNAGAAADLQQQKDMAAANEAFAGRRMDAAQFNVDAALTQQQTTAEGQRAMRTLTDQDGNANVLRADGSLTPLTGADGRPVQERGDAGQVTPALQYEALSEQIKAINENPMLKADERLAMLAPIQSQMDTLAGKVQQAAPPEVGAVKNGYRFKGGDPSKSDNWEKVQ